MSLISPAGKPAHVLRVTNRITRDLQLANHFYSILLAKTSHMSESRVESTTKFFGQGVHIYRDNN
jgi:hypothetical protein